MTQHARDDVPTLASVGLLISMAASLAHEALGHGLGCLIDGGRITLLTFLVFRCDGAGAVADGAGPVGIFIVACAALAVADFLRSRAPLTRLCLVNLGGIGLLWVCGQAMSEALDGSDDWGHVASDLGWPHYWHWIVGSGGVVGYAVTLRVVRHVSSDIVGGRPGRLMVPYLAATASAVLLGALWQHDRMASALDGFLSFGVAPVGYILLARRYAEATPVSAVIARRTGFLVAVTALWLVFALTVARGLGVLS